MTKLVKKCLRISVIAVNLLLFCIIGTWYFFAFDIQWGLTWQAFTWGLPLLIAALLVMICIIKFIKRRKWRWGLSGIGIAVLVIIYTASILIFLSYHVIGEPENGPLETLDTEENRILTMVLSEFFDDSISYVVIDPELSTEIIGSDIEEREHTKEWIQENFILRDEQGDITFGYKNADFSRLIDRFLEINQDPGRLTLKSSPEDGYYIDYDGKFSRYFDAGVVQGWARIRSCRPGVSMADVLLPAYDPEENLILMYIGNTGGPLSGFGDIFLMKMENGKLETIGWVMVWIS